MDEDGSQWCRVTAGLGISLGCFYGCKGWACPGVLWGIKFATPAGGD